MKCLNLRSMELKEISCAYEPAGGCTCVYKSPGQVYIPLENNDDEYHYAVVSADCVLRYEKEVSILQIGTDNFSLLLPRRTGIERTDNYHFIQYQEVQVIDGTGQAEIIDLKCKSRPIGIFEIGNKGVIYFVTGKEILSVIESRDKTKIVFSCECIRSQTAMAVHDSLIYLSLKRFERIGRSGFGYSRFQNDEMEGTYIIDMTDLSVKKISNYIYSGLYNLDDTCLYGTDENGNIYQIGFNGESKLIYSQ